MTNKLPIKEQAAYIALIAFFILAIAALLAIPAGRLP